MNSLRDRLAAALDPVAAVRLYLRLDPSAEQVEILRARGKRNVVVCTRGFGKSTVMAWKCAHILLTEPGALCLLVSPSGRQSAELLAKARALLIAAGIRAKGDGANEYSLVAPNGARLVGLPGMADTVRGFHGARLLIFEEAAYVRDSVYSACRAFLAVGGGEEWLVSTPRGKIGFFWERASKPEFRYAVWRVTYKDVPWISAEFIAEERSGKGERVFRQEYEAEFLDVHDSVFNSEKLLGAVREDLQPEVIV